MDIYISQFVRVVKEFDSKSNGFTRASSNPAADVFKNYIYILYL
jgi:hypothetical protein